METDAKLPCKTIIRAQTLRGARTISRFIAPQLCNVRHYSRSIHHLATIQTSFKYSTSAESPRCLLSTCAADKQPRGTRLRRRAVRQGDIDRDTFIFRRKECVSLEPVVNVRRGDESKVVAFES